MNDTLLTSLRAAHEKLLIDAIELEDLIVSSPSQHVTRQLLGRLHEVHYKSAEVAIEIRILVLADPPKKSIFQKLLGK